MILKSPFPWFGGKSRASAEIWNRFGDVPNYVGPFAGSLAVLLNRPHAPHTETVNDSNGMTAVLLDLPYSHDERQADLYANDHDVAADVRQWAIENGDNQLLRVALCGYEGEHEMPDTWSIYRWKARGGYGSQGNSTGRENAVRECIWFSPHCLGDHDNLPIFKSYE